MGRTRVLLADDHTATIKNWCALLESDYQIVGIVADGTALVEAATRLAPDVIVADIQMPSMSGLTAVETIIRQRPASRVVIATVHADRTLLRKCLALGVFGYVLKVRVGEDLVPAIEAALRGELHISPFPPRELVTAIEDEPY